MDVLIFTILLVDLIFVYILADTNTIISGSCPEDIDECTGPRFRRLFKPPVEPVPEYQHDDSKLWTAFREQRPMLIKGRPILRAIDGTSITLEYLKTHLSDSPERFNTFLSSDRLIQDHNDDNNLANYKIYDRYVNKDLTFKEFIDSIGEVDRARNSSRMFLQAILEDSFLARSRLQIDEKFLTSVTTSGTWGESLKNVLLIGMKDYSRNVHIDYDEALLQQVFGHKRVLLFEPSHYGNVYPYPVHHARDRYSRVNFDNIDYVRYPKVGNLSGHEAILCPGDVLYIPTMWWHYVESEIDSITMSVGFRYLAPEIPYYLSFPYSFKTDGPKAADGIVQYDDVITISDTKTGYPALFIQKPDSAHALVHIRRHIEHMIAEATGNFRKVPDILHEILDGRYDNLEFSDTP